MVGGAELGGVSGGVMEGLVWGRTLILGLVRFLGVRARLFRTGFSCS
jgi:hypothetical protein